jgi:hypothetical protein
MKHISLVCCTVLVLLFGGLASSASANGPPGGEGWIESVFYIALTSDNEFVSGLGTGWNNGEWVYYPNTEWYNQWFYDHPPRPFPWYKEIYYSIDAGTGVYPAGVDIVINWSSLAFPESGPAGPPPIPPLTETQEAEYIVRDHVVYSGEVGSEIQHFEGPIVIPDYNPEWVSIDVRAWPINGEDIVNVSGTIWHRCVPEPSTLMLLASAAVVLLLFVRRRR